MRMARGIRAGGVWGLLAVMAWPAILAWAATETTELVTYFPSASTDVEELRARRGAIGDDTYWKALGATPPPPVGTLLVQGPMTIGTTTPDKLNLADAGRPLTVVGATAGERLASFLAPLAAGERTFLRIGQTATAEGATFGYLHQPTANAASGFIGDAQGTPQLVVTGAGNVGLGTTAPAAHLDIAAAVKPSGDAFGDNLLFQIRALTPPTGDHGRLWFQYGPNAAPLMVLSDFNDPSRIQFQQTGTGILTAPQYAGWIGLARKDSSDLAIMGGNVGVGTVAPTALLHVETNANQPMGFRARNLQNMPFVAGTTRVALQGETRDANGALNVIGALGWRTRLPNLSPRQAAVYGEAPDKIETYAGYFQGDVKINGDVEVTGRIINPSGVSQPYSLGHGVYGAGHGQWSPRKSIGRHRVCFVTAFQPRCLGAHNTAVIVRGEPGGDWWMQVQCADATVRCLD